MIATPEDSVFLDAVIKFIGNEIEQVLGGFLAGFEVQLLPVAADVVEEGLQLVGNSIRSAHELGDADALAVMLGHLPDGHRLGPLRHPVWRTANYRLPYQP